jgi:hypothetical protein
MSDRPHGTAGEPLAGTDCSDIALKTGLTRQVAGKARRGPHDHRATRTPERHVIERGTARRLDLCVGCFAFIRTGVETGLSPGTMRQRDRTISSIAMEDLQEA